MNERRLRRIFEISVLLKGAHALVELIAGIWLYFVSAGVIPAWVNFLTQEELLEDPNDFVATHLVALARHFSVGDKAFYAFYLLAHGLIKVFLAAGLLRNKLWAYPASLGALAGFVLYQLYRYSYTHSPVLLALTVFDLFVLALIRHEWKLVRRRSQPERTSGRQP